MKTFADFGIDLRGREGEVKTTCPQCSAHRRKKNYPCLNVNTDKGVWHCWHCDWAGTLKAGEEQRPVIHKTYRKPDYAPPLMLDNRAVKFFQGRGIDLEVVDKARVGFGKVYMPQVEEEVYAIQFPYFAGGQCVNVKYRQVDAKHFRMHGGAERILYGLDDISEHRVVFVEGEMDKLAMATAEIWSCVSVPDGAPAPGTKNYASKLDYLDTERLVNVRQIVLATDDDEPGHTLREELARRLGRDRCCTVTWPQGCKDANDVLLKQGAHALRQMVENAVPYPISGAFEGKDLADRVLSLWRNGSDKGLSTGWRNVDAYYTVRPGEMTVITGIPNSGKSNWLDALLVNMSRLHGWRFALFSPENQPLEDHAARLCEKYVGMPFSVGPRQRMGEADVIEGMRWVDDRFFWILPEDDNEWLLDNILGIAKALVRRKGVRGLVIDPWNEMEHQRPRELSETEYVSVCLRRIRQFARQHDVHVWVVAHPAKMTRAPGKDYPIPTLYDISGSANFRNKADNGLVLWRDFADPQNPQLSVHVQKIRFRQVGRLGCAVLHYDKATATYGDEANVVGIPSRRADID